MFMGRGVSTAALCQQLRQVTHPMWPRGSPLRGIGITDIPESKVYNWCDCYFVPADEASGNVEQRLRTVMRIRGAALAVLASRQFPSDSVLKAIGYTSTATRL
jgi:hypothetical protein